MSTQSSGMTMHALQKVRKQTMQQGKFRQEHCQSAQVAAARLDLAHGLALGEHAAARAQLRVQLLHHPLCGAARAQQSSVTYEIPRTAYGPFVWATPPCHAMPPP